MLKTFHLSICFRAKKIIKTGLPGLYDDRIKRNYSDKVSGTLISPLAIFVLNSSI